jgi:hypothetical protein
VSAARHAHGFSVPAADEQAGAASSPVIPLLVVVLGLAIATVWFVAIPLVNRPAHVERGCEVIVLASGKTKCVASVKGGRNAVHAKSKPPKR